MNKNYLFIILKYDINHNISTNLHPQFRFDSSFSKRQGPVTIMRSMLLLFGHTMVLRECSKDFHRPISEGKFRY